MIAILEMEWITRARNIGEKAEYSCSQRWSWSEVLMLAILEMKWSTHARTSKRRNTMSSTLATFSRPCWRADAHDSISIAVHAPSTSM